MEIEKRMKFLEDVLKEEGIIERKGNEIYLRGEIYLRDFEQHSTDTKVLYIKVLEYECQRASEEKWSEYLKKFGEPLDKNLKFLEEKYGV